MSGDEALDRSAGELDANLSLPVAPPFPPAPLSTLVTRPRHTRSFVYAIWSERERAFKLGHAVNPTTRLQKTNRERPGWELSLIAIGHCLVTPEYKSPAERVEQDLHQRLGRYKATRQQRGWNAMDWYVPEGLPLALEIMAEETTLVPPQVVAQGAWGTA